MDDTLKKLEKILEDLNNLEIDHSKMDFREFLETLVEHFIRTMDAIGMSTTVVTRHPKVKLILVMGDDDPAIALQALHNGLNGVMTQPSPTNVMN